MRYPKREKGSEMLEAKALQILDLIEFLYDEYTKEQHVIIFGNLICRHTSESVLHYLVFGEFSD